MVAAHRDMSVDMQPRLYLAGLMLAMLSSAASGAESCTCRHLAAPPLSRLGAENARPQFEPEANDLKGFSSFRGVRLDMQESDAQQALERLGYALVSLQTTETAREICSGGFSMGTLRFDAKRRVSKIELNPAYFGVGRTYLREFADDVFKRFAVRKVPVNDDVCFGDITCFRGTSSAEQFLILRIADDVQLHISHRPGHQVLGSEQ
jgi:hypothetical protein